MEKRPPFRELFGDNVLTGDDSEGYLGPDDYQQTAHRLSLVTQGEITIEYLGGTKDGDTANITLQLRINGQPVDMVLDGSSDYMDATILEKINDVLEAHRLTTKRYYYVEPDGLENADQGFTVAFIDAEVFARLKYFGYTHESDRDQWQEQEIDEMEDFEDLMRI